MERSGCLPQSASFKVIELDFLKYLFIVVKPWLLVRESKVAMQLYVAFRKSVVVSFQHHHVLSGVSCVFIHPCSRGFVLVLSFWISSCTCCGTVAPSSIYYHWVHLLYLVVIALLLPLLRGFTPASRIEYIPKYSSIENFIKLPFQWVLIRLNRSPNEGAMAVSLQHCLLSRISACATIRDSAISACRNLRLPCRLIRWSVDFMQLLKIQIYLIFSAEAHANIAMTSLSFRPSIRRCACGLHLEVF
jgi:hypothetical protein